MTSPSPSPTLRTTAFFVVLFLVLGLVQVIPAVLEAATDRTGDLGRHWVVTQYIIHRVNPYPIAFEALRARYGILAPRGPVHLRDIKIYTTPKTGPHPQTDPVLGVPEAVYPPMAIMTLLPLGFLPVDVVRFLWLIVNVAAILLVTHELYLLTGPGPLRWLLILGLVTAWPAVSYCLAREQLSLLALCCILVARRLEPGFPIVAGLLYGVSMVKPGLAVPFLLLPFLARRITVLAVFAASQLALLGTMCWWVYATPIDLLREWLSVAVYVRQGMYTVQDLINLLHLDGTIADAGSQVIILLLTLMVASRLGFEKRIAFLAVVSCIWSYHALYDFCAMLVVVALMVEARVDRRWMLSAAALCVVAIGLTRPVYGGTTMAERGIRWATRLSLAVLVVSVTQTEFLAGPSERRGSPYGLVAER